MRDNVLQGVRDKKLLVDEWRAVEAQTRGRAEHELEPKLRQQHQRLKKLIEDGNLLDLERRIEVAMDALNCPNGDLAVTGLSGVRARCCRDAVAALTPRRVNGDAWHWRDC